MALEIKTLWKLSPYPKPDAIPAAMAYTFFKTAAYSVPIISFPVVTLTYAFDRVAFICSALKESIADTVR